MTPRNLRILPFKRNPILGSDDALAAIDGMTLSAIALIWQCNLFLCWRFKTSLEKKIQIQKLICNGTRRVHQTCRQDNLPGYSWLLQQQTVAYWLILVPFLKLVSLDTTPVPGLLTTGQTPAQSATEKYRVIYNLLIFKTSKNLESLPSCRVALWNILFFKTTRSSELGLERLTSQRTMWSLLLSRVVMKIQNFIPFAEPSRIFVTASNTMMFLWFKNWNR